MPTSGKGKASGDVEFLKNIAYLIKETGMSYDEVISLPYQIFLGLLKQFRILTLESTEEGQDYLKQCRVLNTKEADVGSLRKLKQKLDS